MNFLRRLEGRFGRFAISNLTMYIVITYAAGYVLELMQKTSGVNLIGYLSLNPGAVLHGQVWRLFSWVLMPPGSLDIFTLIMLVFYYQIGRTLERVWGDFLYTVYIVIGLLMTILGAFLCYAIYGSGLFTLMDQSGVALITTYYISLSLFLGFAMTVPNERVLFMMLIPIRMKYLAFLDLAYLAYAIFQSNMKLLTIILIVCSLANTILFFLASRLGGRRFGSSQTQRSYRKVMRMQASGRQRSSVSSGMGGQASGRTEGIARHRCAVCGRTEITNPELEFRYCSKCSGDLEYCMDHLYSHEHKQS